MALLALLAGGAGGVRSANAQQPPAGGACTTPDTVAFRGNSRVSESALRGDVAIVPGATVNYRALQRAIKSLYATGQFDDIQIKCEVAAGRSLLAFEFTERLLLAEVDVTGPARVAPGTVRDQVDILVGRPIDPAQVARVLARIDSVYAAKGYYLAQARAETTTVATGAKVTFVVDEGNRLAVSGIQIAGNQRISDREVVESMNTKPEGFFWWKKGEFDDDKYAADLTEKIPQTYGKHGFIDVQVVRDTLVIDRDRGKALVDVAVSEGPQYVVGDFEVNGARRFSSDELRRFYPFTERGRTLKEAVGGLAGVVLRRSTVKDPENVFDQSKWDEATRQVQEAYMNEGYIYAQVRPVVERLKVGTDSVPTVNLRWDIDERTPAIVNRVDILGNDITVEQCIRDQIMMLPGDVFSRNLLMQSYQNISQMQFFETPVPDPDTRQANEQGDIDIIFRVREKKTGNVNFGASVGQGTGVGGFIGFDQPNLFGLCKRGSLQWQFGRYINDFNLSYTDPRIRQSRISGTATAYHTRSRFTVGNLGRTTRAGGQLRFGFRVPRSRYTRLFLDYGGESVKYGEEGLASTINCGSGGCFRSSVGVTIARETLIDLPFPSGGARQSFESQFNGGPLGGTAAYQRYRGEIKGFATLATFGGGSPGSQPLKLVTGLTSKAGALFGNPGPFFIYQQFSLGGVQYGEQLRGYEEFSITPNGYAFGTGFDRAQQESFGSAFFTTSAELGLRISQQLYLSSFLDVGNVWARPRDFNPTRLFRGAGFGASLVTPLGPLGLDMGYGFDRLDQFGRRAPAWQVHFKFGQFF